MDPQKLAVAERKIASLNSKYDLPDYVKSASLYSTLVPGELEVTQYADQRNREFPCHTKAATWCSVAEFVATADRIPATRRELISKNLYKLAGFWNVLDDIRQMKPSPQEKQAAASSFCVYDNKATGTKAMPMHNAQDAVKAAAWLEKNAAQFQFKERVMMARNILAASQHFAAAVGDYDQFLNKTAGYGFCTVKTAAAAISHRAARCSDADWRQKLSKLAERVEQSPQLSLTPDNLMNLGEILDSADQLNTKAIHRTADSLVEQSLFGITYKAAGELKDSVCQTTSGTTYSKTDFKQLKLAELRDLLGDEFADNVHTGMQVDVEKMAEVLATSPRDDAELFDRLMSSKGITPARDKQAGAMPVGFTAEQLMELVELE